MAETCTTAPSERRRAVRRQPTLGTVCQLESPPDQMARTALVWNISPGGLSILFYKALDPDTRLRGEITTLNHTAALSVYLRVKHVKPLQTGDYVLGCQFDRPLTGDEMQPFVGE